MTGKELLVRALALFAETETTDYEALALPYIDMVLAETFDTNNRIRTAAGKAVLTEMPELASLADTLPYEDKLVKLALPYGLAAKLYFDEEDNPRLTMFNQEYADRVNRCDKAVVEF